MKNIFVAVILILIVMLGGCASQEQKTSNDKQLTQIDGFVVNIKATKDNTKVIDGEIFLKQEQSLMDVMKQYFDIETAYDDKFIMGIDGIAPEDVTKEGWIIYINGQMAMVGAKDLIVKKNDKIEFKYEKF